MLFISYRCYNSFNVTVGGAQPVAAVIQEPPQLPYQNYNITQTTKQFYIYDSSSGPL